MAIDIQWRKKFGVGHPDVDREHQLFLDLIRNVSLASERQEPKDWCLRLLREVEKFVDFHFFSEENLMLKTGYPDYVEHQKKHAEFIEGLHERVQAYANDKINLESVVVYLFDWFVMHSAQLDKKLGKFLASDIVSDDASVS